MANPDTQEEDTSIFASIYKNLKYYVLIYFLCNTIFAYVNKDQNDNIPPITTTKNELNEQSYTFKPNTKNSTFANIQKPESPWTTIEDVDGNLKTLLV